jgi:tRNA uracil 4-sulfurtransferase
MDHMTEKRILCRYGELILKSKPVRRQFALRLMTNIRNALRSNAIPYELRSEESTISITATHPDTVSVLSRVYGIATLAEVQTVKAKDLDAVIETACAFFRPSVAGRTFAVRCRRLGTHPFSSMDIEVALGAVLAKHAKVNLTTPDITCKLEIRDDVLNLFASTNIGAGGLPLGVQGRAICLISGGIDSPVAAYHAMRRGLHLDYLFCCLGGPVQTWGPLKTAKQLADFWSYGTQPQFYQVDFTSILAAFQKLDSRYRNILLKRFFFRAASHLADKIGADAIVTGEVLGQVSSQTVTNLATISNASSHLIIRPLIAFDKLEIKTTARRIDTLSISEQVPEFCNVAVSRPKTKCTEREIQALEMNLPENLLESAMQTLTGTDLRSLKEIPYPADFEIRSVPANAEYVWIQAADDRSPPPENVTCVIGATEIREKIKAIPKIGPVVVHCRKGLLSRDTAAYMREQGYEAYHLKLTR